jgi:hypothetical protein
LDKAKDQLMESEQLESIAAVTITAGAHDSNVDALAAEEASSTAFLALGIALKAISAKE